MLAISCAVGNNDRDTHMTFDSGLTINGYVPKQLALVRKGAKPKTLNIWCYALATITLLSWPYRWWFSSISGKKNFVFTKVVSI
jgi:hypothetical protein